MSKTVVGLLAGVAIMLAVEYFNGPLLAKRAA